MRARYEATTLAAAVERDTLLQQLRGTEERAATEIDRARQDANRLQAEAKIQARQQNQERAVERQTREALQRQLQESLREGDMQRARADTLEQQLARLADLPANVEAALRRNHSAVKAKRSAAASKRPKR